MSSQSPLVTHVDDVGPALPPSPKLTLSSEASKWNGFPSRETSPLKPKELESTSVFVATTTEASSRQQQSTFDFPSANQRAATDERERKDLELEAGRRRRRGLGKSPEKKIQSNSPKKPKILREEFLADHVTFPLFQQHLD